MKKKTPPKADSGNQISIRLKPEEKQMLESAYNLYASRTSRPLTKSGFYRNLLLEALNMGEGDDDKEDHISTDKIELVKDLSTELNILINNLDDDQHVMSGLIRVVQMLKSLTGYKKLPEGDLVSTPSIPFLNAKTN